ncbi:roadblock/LC7 domain-containing protein [Frankia sp. AgB1.9]|jgi:predicted regulator of Ras-like GTPase activity (Roadblock/LC7/MglB family)|uniref:Roadblock/LC7 family protein n=1 Tax=Pseudofrankia inefficax (strain DSM 45817 / CECT 9037 / DDB 130130 / EuI1c) TaxID=298654 RepID=E3IZI1_PSEI1|nr:MULTISPECIES: roadblock/LC7 domain-containing protein [Frankiaceae]ADP82751.1 Roadblock/LC7 family protein [Pseudofrankia inefficax]MBL7489811.1 roadblock/LC7 domain-containing protein [Frankia sp. AgW1.1]MBL7550271.1 roadblock/LC7 domain-containing protein [Frankia sp. AgB1.9]MBL7623064.1 roadblock/LC7 domain-containing protein [Frankia sp. AgB1.8]
MSPVGPSENMSWLLNNLVKKVPEVTYAIALSSDGLLLATSAGMDRATADQLAAVASGFNSLARGAGRFFGGGSVRQTIVEMEQGFLFVTAVGDGACMAILSSPGADIGLIAYEMALLVTRVGEFLTPELRAEMQAALPI